MALCDFIVQSWMIPIVGGSVQGAAFGSRAISRALSRPSAGLFDSLTAARTSACEVDVEIVFAGAGLVIAALHLLG